MMAAADGSQARVTSPRAGAVSLKHEPGRETTMRRMWRSFSIAFLGKHMSVDDFTSMLDQLLLVVTLLLGFVINNMTASALGKDDYTARDAWAVSFAAMAYGHDSSGTSDVGNVPNVPSYEVIQAGCLSISLLILSLSMGLGLYLALNMSAARESEEVFAVWAKVYLPVLWASYGALIAAIFFFYENYLNVAEIIFPLYCFDEMVPPSEVVDAERKPTVYDLNQISMVEIAAGEFNECKGRSFTYQYLEESSSVTYYLAIGLICLLLVINMAVHVFALDEDADARRQRRHSELDSSTLKLLEPFGDEAALEYADKLADANVTAAQLAKMTYEQLREVGFSVGHAIALRDAMR